MKQDFPIDDAHRATDPLLKDDPDLQKWVDHYRRMGIAAVVRQWGNFAVDYDGLTRHTCRDGYAVFREYSDAEMKKGRV